MRDYILFKDQQKTSVLINDNNTAGIFVYYLTPYHEGAPFNAMLYTLDRVLSIPVNTDLKEFPFIKALGSIEW